MAQVAVILASGRRVAVKVASGPLPGAKAKAKKTPKTTTAKTV